MLQRLLHLIIIIPSSTAALIRFAGLNVSIFSIKSAASSGTALDRHCKNGRSSTRFRLTNSRTSAFSIISKSYSQQKPRIPTSSDGLPKKRRIRSISLSAFGAWESSKPAGITWKMEDPWSISANTTPQDQISTLFVYV